MAETRSNGKWTQVPAWLAIGLTVIGIAAGGWMKAGALEQRVLTLEARDAALDQQISQVRSAYEQSALQTSVDVAQLKGSLDYVKAVVTDLRARQR